MDRIQAFDFSVDVLSALLWQYNEAYNLQGLLEKKAEWYLQNQTEFWQDWYRDVFDIRTANAFGLAVWAIILNAPLFITIEPGTSRPSFGFKVTGAITVVHANFNNGNFGTNGQDSVAGLTMENARLLLRLRYFKLTMRPSVTVVNKFMNELFKDMGQVAVVDNHDMSIQYSFLFALPSVLEYVFSNWEIFDALPRPAGVDLNIQTVTRDTFGFGEYHDNFNNGNFGD